jgi:hypothetical protein
MQTKDKFVMTVMERSEIYELNQKMNLLISQMKQVQDKVNNVDNRGKCFAKEFQGGRISDPNFNANSTQNDSCKYIKYCMHLTN